MCTHTLTLQLVLLKCDIMQCDAIHCNVYDWVSVCVSLVESLEFTIFLSYKLKVCKFKWLWLLYFQLQQYNSIVDLVNSHSSWQASKSCDDFICSFIFFSSFSSSFECGNTGSVIVSRLCDRDCEIAAFYIAFVMCSSRDAIVSQVDERQWERGECECAFSLLLCWLCVNVWKKAMCRLSSFVSSSSPRHFLLTHTLFLFLSRLRLIL